MEAANRSAPHSQDTARSNPNKREAGIPQVIAGRYRVINRLGGGSFGDVYRVSDEVDGGRELALKILRSSDPVALRYFKREFRSLADVYHPNIARLYELVASEDRWLFTMELVDGVNFLQYLDRQLPEDREESLRSCLLQLAEGLETLHRRKLLHRDLKPSNVLVTSAGRVVILDFGLVRSFDEGIHSLVTLAGTPDYMAPEQGTGEVSIEASDWYAVGVMLYQSLTGRLPFEGNLVEVFHSKQFERPIPAADLVPNVSPELNELCVRLLKRDPARRGSYEDVTGLAGPGAYVQSRQRQRLATVSYTHLRAHETPEHL